MAAVSQNDVFGIIPFDGENISFINWKRRVTAVFSAKELSDFLETEPQADNQEQNLKAKKAYALLLTLLTDKVLTSLQEENTACKIWNKLERTYNKKGAVNQILIRKRLATIKKNRDVSMKSHIDEICKLVCELKLSEAEVSETDNIVYILMSLPQEFENVRVALENQPSENLTLDFVTQRLLDAEALLNDSKKEKSRLKSPSENGVFVASRKEFYCKNCNLKGHTIKFCRKKPVCFRCKKNGHLKRNCPLNNSNEEKLASSAVSFVVGDTKRNNFIIDSGATAHMSSNERYFTSLVPSSGRIKCASKNVTLEVKGTGNIKGKTSSGVEVTLKDVLFVPDLNGELISVRKIESANFTVIFKEEKVFIENESNFILFGHRDDSGQYISDFTPIYQDDRTVLVSEESECDLWHRRLGHSGDHVLKIMNLPTPNAFCDICSKAKQTATAVGKAPRKRETKPMVMIHTDICGPIVPETYSSEKYFMTITDDYSRFTEVRLLKQKSEVASELKSFLKKNPSVRKIRCDNGKEYINNELLNFAADSGILIDPAPPYTAFLNGVSERANRSLLDKGRALILEANLPKEFWGQAILAATYLKNRLPSRSIENCTPYYLKYGEEPDLKNIRVFGCDAYMTVPSSQRKKLDDKSKLMIFIGYSSMGYRLMDPVTKKIVVSRNVKFNEEKKKIDKSKIYITEDSDPDESEIYDDQENSDDELNTVDQNQDIPRRSERLRKVPIRYPETESYEAMLSCQESVSFEDLNSLSNDEQLQWKRAMNEEIESMKTNDVWNLERLPPDKHSISCKWVLTRKRDGRYKARLVARGFMQSQGLDYSNTFSPVISMPALRLVLIVIVNENLHVFALDVKTAFLNGKLNELIFMDQPAGYDDNTGRKCRLKRSIYGLKQSPRQWYQRFLEFITKLNFKSLDNEPCIFIRIVNCLKVIIALYVDDVLIAGSDINEINVIISLLSKEFKMSKTEKVSEFLGIRMKFNPNCLIMDQESYILRLLSKFNMIDCKTTDIPINPKSTPADFVKGNVFNGPYRELVGCLLYLAYVSRPDILYAVNCLSQSQEHPTEVGWCALKKILRYLKGTAKLKLVYEKENAFDNNLCMYVDADWGANVNDRKSVTGYVVMFCNLPVLWNCNKQKCIALSSTEAEVIALSKGIQDLLWLKNLISEILNISSVSIFEDNQSCIKFISNENSKGRMKHIDVKIKFVRDIINENNIKIEYVPTGIQIADIFTKALPKVKFRELLSLLKLCD